MIPFNRTEGKTRNARRLRLTATDMERKLWARLRSARVDGASFRRQHPAGRYVLDFYCPALRIAVEVDGGQHGEPANQSADEMREAWPHARGVTVLRFWNSDVSENIEGVLETISLAIAEAKRKMTPTRSAARSGLPLSGGGGASRKRSWKLEPEGSDATPAPERGRSGQGHDR